MNGARNSVCNGVTHGVHNAERRCVQNQNQNQSSSTASWGVSINESIHRQGSRAAQHRLGWMGCAEGGGW